MTYNLKLTLVPAYLLLCLLLGGASAAGFWANMLLQLLAVALIFWSFAAPQKAVATSPTRQLLALLSLLCLVILLQLMPLPASVWANLPGREAYAAIYPELGRAVPWLPLSMAPHQTKSSALWLLPAIAVLLAITRLGFYKPSRVAWTVAGGAVAGVLLGALQMGTGGGTGNPWYIYRINNTGVATGFFANANHMASLLVVTVPFLSALYLSSREMRHSPSQRSALAVILGGVLVVVVVGVGLNRSLAGIGLIVPTIMASYLMHRHGDKPAPRWAIFSLPLLAAAAALLVFNGTLDAQLAALDAKSSIVPRQEILQTTSGAVGDFFPFGSGLGTFRDIYATYEQPHQVTRTYINHAHNDYVELTLETGLLGLTVIVLFMIWWLRRAIQIWRSTERNYYACAATIASAAILAHSTVDYPLRTAAISVVFAACCALMAEPREFVDARRKRRRTSKVRHLSAEAA